MSHTHHCDCGCEEHHHKHHEHHHHHETNCDCPECQSHGNTVVDSALICSRKLYFHMATPMTAETAFQSLSAQIANIAGKLAVENDILGHVKLLMDCEAGQTSLSLTRMDAQDVTYHPNWQSVRMVDHCKVSVNILSLANQEIPVEKLLDEIKL